MSECLFCRIIAGEVPGNVVFQDQQLTAFRDINPQAPVHILIVPREHIPSLAEVAPGQAELVGKLHLAAAELARRAGLTEQGWRVVSNVGADAGQTVPHLHLHLLGGRPFGWPPG